MNRTKRNGSALSAVILSLVLTFAAAVAAQNTASISGQVIDPDGKPWEGLTIKFSNDRGQKVQTTTDAEGKFKQLNLAAGNWVVQMFHGETIIRDLQTRVTTGQEIVFPVINFKELIAADPKLAAERKKQEEEKLGFEAMKANFDAGVVSMQSADSLQAQLSRTPADQKAALQEKITEQRQSAITSFVAADAAVGEKDPNKSLVLGNLGAAYKSVGKYSEAIEAYTRAIALKPEPGYYVGLAESQARTDKVPDAVASCGLIPAATAATNAATCYRNLGIVLYNTNKFQEAIEPLTKATELDPKNAQAWYVLGASLVPLADFKEEKGTLKMTPKPGTIEAYQKAIELDPNGPYGTQAKEGLAQLEQMGAGISTSIKAGKKRN